MVAQATCLVTGASGALGTLVVQEMLRSSPVVAGTRRPDLPARPWPDVRRVDFDDPASLASGFRGIDRLLIVSTDALDVPGKRRRQHRAALDAAVEAGVGYVAYSSMPRPADSPSISFAGDHAAMESALSVSGLPHGILRNGWYQENLLGYLPRIIADGRWFTAAGEGRIAHVARADAARAAAALLRSAEAGVFDIAGPKALTVAEIAGAVRDVLGRRLDIVHVDGIRLAEELARQGIPAPAIPLVAMTEANQRQGRFEVGLGVVERLTGDPARSIYQFLHDHRDALTSVSR